MLTVEQVRNLDGKVRQALDLIDKLKAENNMLRSKLDEYRQRVDQLEGVVDGFKLEQLEIEEGIKDVLRQLDQLEDQITAPAQPESGNSGKEQAAGREFSDAVQHATQQADIPEPVDAETGASVHGQNPESEAATQSADRQNGSAPPELEIF